MKVMISMPMNGKSDEEVNDKFQDIKKKLEALHIEVIDTVFKECPEGDKYIEPALYYMARSIDSIGQVDAVFFADGWQQARGCKIEYEVCCSYGVKTLFSDFINKTSPSHNILYGSDIKISKNIGEIFGNPMKN